jgi:transposase
VQPERDVRVQRAQRGQITWGRVDLDAEVPADHEVRAIAAVVDKLDLRGLHADVRARGEIAGAPATDPKILLGLWVYATSDGVGSGREIGSRGSRTHSPSFPTSPRSRRRAAPKT